MVCRARRGLFPVAREGAKGRLGVGNPPVSSRECPQAGTTVPGGHKLYEDRVERKSISTEEWIMSSKLMKYFNSQPRIGTLSTADAGGRSIPRCWDRRR
ncbi:MAG: hypothetical protein ACP5C4_01915 [Methanomicrobiales archaeon]